VAEHEHERNRAIIQHLAEGATLKQAGKCSVWSKQRAHQITVMLLGSRPQITWPDERTARLRAASCKRGPQRRCAGRVRSVRWAGRRPNERLCWLLPATSETPSPDLG
jgi:hypothetical protein